METYHKIQTLFKRDMANKGKMLMGQWTTPELEYLAPCLWEYTEKVDGTNIRVQYVPNDTMKASHVNFAGRSDNATLPKPLLELLTEHFTPEQFHAADFKDTEVLLFGEGYGAKIQGGGKYRDDQSFVLFDVKIGDFWLYREDVNDIAKKLGIESVPVIGEGTLYKAIDIVESGITFNDHGGIVRWGDHGLKSQYGDFEAEGIVARPKVPLFNRKGERIITKIKSVDFK